MTVPSTTYRNDYTGTAGTLVFPYTFRILDSADIVVTAQYTTGDPVTVTSGFTVSGVGSQSGGNITFSSAPFDDATLVSLTFTRNPADTQTFDIRNQTAIPRASLEDALDRRTMVSLKQQEELDRCIKIPITQTGVSVSLPIPEANKYLAWNAGGNALNNMGASTATAVGAGTDLGLGEVVSTGTTESRTLSAHFSDFLSVKDFGAIGDGVADDTASIQAAINAAYIGASPYSGNKTVYIPPGVYKITSSLEINDYQRITGAGPFQTILRGSINTSYIRSTYGESPLVGERNTAFDISNLSIQNATLVTGSIGINFKNCQYSKITDVFMANLDYGIITDQYTQYDQFTRIVVQVANYGALFQSIGGGNRLVSCDFGGYTVPLDLTGGAWELLGCSAEALGAGATYCVRVGRPGGQSTTLHAHGLYVEGVSAGTITMQIENSVNRSIVSLHRHSTLGSIVNNASESCDIIVPGQGYYSPVSRLQRLEFGGTIDGSAAATIQAKAGSNVIQVRNAANDGYGDAYTRNVAMTGDAIPIASGWVSLGKGTASTVGAAGGASALPATPLGYLIAYVGTTQVKIPYYTAS